MILIISGNEKDNETDLVCRSLMYQEIDFLRLNMDDFLGQDAFVGQDFFVLKGRKYAYHDFDLVWVRRNIASFNSMFRDEAFDYRSNLAMNLYNKKEWNLFAKFFFTQFPQERMVNEARGYFADKVDQLNLARKIGLPTADSLFSNNARDLQRYEQRAVISKPAGNLGYVRRNEAVVKAYTEVVDHETLPANFLNAFFQEKLEGIHEIRSLYLDGEMYNCGLIKPNNSENHIDVKRQEGLRCQPVSLPPTFAAKVKEFMQGLGFRIGFIDILKTATGYKFIEMNPYGKFLFYSNACNFNFDHRIANFLIHEARRNQ